LGNHLSIDLPLPLFSTRTERLRRFLQAWHCAIQIIRNTDCVSQLSITGLIERYGSPIFASTFPYTCFEGSNDRDHAAVILAVCCIGICLREVNPNCPDVEPVIMRALSELCTGRFGELCGHLEAAVASHRHFYDYEEAMSLSRMVQSQDPVRLQPFVVMAAQKCALLIHVGTSLSGIGGYPVSQSELEATFGVIQLLDDLVDLPEDAIHGRDFNGVLAFTTAFAERWLSDVQPSSVAEQNIDSSVEILRRTVRENVKEVTEQAKHKMGTNRVSDYLSEYRLSLARTLIDYIGTPRHRDIERAVCRNIFGKVILTSVGSL
jgi:hypothetical protein